MSDPVGLIGGAGGAGPADQPAARRALGPGESPFKDLLIKNIREVNQLQADAEEAIEDLQTGRRDDVESVIIATNKADTAFKMLQAMRNRVMQAYEEIQQMRV
jgi:flagellar hook-basal body complex protein FliE